MWFTWRVAVHVRPQNSPLVSVLFCRSKEKRGPRPLFPFPSVGGTVKKVALKGLCGSFICHFLHTSIAKSCCHESDHYDAGRTRPSPGSFQRSPPESSEPEPTNCHRVDESHSSCPATLHLHLFPHLFIFFLSSPGRESCWKIHLQ